MAGRILERLIVGLIYLSGVSSILFVFGIFFFVVREGYPVLVEAVGIGDFLSIAWYPTSETNTRYGLLALLAGTFSVTLLAMAVAVPFALGGAVLISEFCTGKVKETLKITVELLAAVPSVVWGFIGLAVFNPLIIWSTGAPIGLNVLNGGLVVGFMSIPIIVSIAEDALKAVPDTYREAAEALGATRWEVVHRVVFPAAKNGLLAAVLLGVGRGVGETMAVLMATGHAVNLPFDGSFPFFHPLDSVRTLTATIASELGESARLDPDPTTGLYPQEAHHYQVLFVLGGVLFALTFCINLIADLVVRGVRKQEAA
jgi:phosphate transport system permease protein